VELESRPGRSKRPKHRWWKEWRRQLRRYRILLIMTLTLGVLVAGGLVVARSFTRKLPLPTRLVNASRVAVRLSLNQDLQVRTTFSDENETDIEAQPGGKYLVTGWLDLSNDAGVITRQTYSCILYPNPEGDLVAENITILPQ
jgi:hypothetical protein